ncbi:Fasciclin-like arabinogalactan protein [Vigna angularis]|uniref:Fasciclin-like arabinogalactan protein n=1 Tax=Phaseolus angularis TaxID=3914 RepID=A0A8T0LAR5_PHAAN|nr:Fasciclin-like arabinogalactan protein [Vigna angularis]
MNNTRMIDEKNPELTNEGLSPALGSGSINFPSSRKILVETVSKMRVVWWVQKDVFFEQDVEGPFLPGFSTFNHYLTLTHLADEINHHQTITVLAVDNGAMNALLDKHLTLPTLKSHADTIFSAYFIPFKKGTRELREGEAKSDSNQRDDGEIELPRRITALPTWVRSSTIFMALISGKGGS